jgi:hypothetical protein
VTKRGVPLAAPVTAASWSGWVALPVTASAAGSITGPDKSSGRNLNGKRKARDDRFDAGLTQAVNRL